MSPASTAWRIGSGAWSMMVRARSTFALLVPTMRAVSCAERGLVSPGDFATPVARSVRSPCRFLLSTARMQRSRSASVMLRIGRAA